VRARGERGEQLQVRARRIVAPLRDHEADARGRFVGAAEQQHDIVEIELVEERGAREQRLAGKVVDRRALALHAQLHQRRGVLLPQRGERLLSLRRHGATGPVRRLHSPRLVVAVELVALALAVEDVVEREVGREPVPVDVAAAPAHRLLRRYGVGVGERQEDSRGHLHVVGVAGLAQPAQDAPDPPAQVEPGRGSIGFLAGPVVAPVIGGGGLEAVPEDPEHAGVAAQLGGLEDVAQRLKQGRAQRRLAERVEQRRARRRGIDEVELVEDGRVLVERKLVERRGEHVGLAGARGLVQRAGQLVGVVRLELLVRGRIAEQEQRLRRDPLDVVRRLAMAVERRERARGRVAAAPAERPGDAVVAHALAAALDVGRSSRADQRDQQRLGLAQRELAGAPDRALERPRASGGLVAWPRSVRSVPRP
jgi:hypothetical protein